MDQSNLKLSLFQKREKTHTDELQALEIIILPNLFLSKLYHYCVACIN